MMINIIKSTISFEYNINASKNMHIINKLCNIMHDIDYSYFYDFDKLCEADEKIKKEYLTFINEDLFNNGRTQFLNKLTKKDIYRSIYMKYNNIAKYNIEKLIKLKYS